jgi:hypothetical protein
MELNLGQDLRRGGRENQRYSGPSYTDRCQYYAPHRRRRLDYLSCRVLLRVLIFNGDHDNVLNAIFDSADFMNKLISITAGYKQERYDKMANEMQIMIAKTFTPEVLPGKP